MDFQIFPEDAADLFEDHDIAVHAFNGGVGVAYETRGSVFFSVISGRPMINGYRMTPGMFGCLPLFGEFVGRNCRVMIVKAKHHVGIFGIGGPIEERGRLRYIDGCTDTGIIPPLRLGDPCLNVLYFPERTLQTPHTHPSHRIGAIFDGEGYCLTGTDLAQRVTPMRQGDIFMIPQDVVHWFSTEEQGMRIMVFHPDSEFGPTDELHQMREATILAA